MAIDDKLKENIDNSWRALGFNKSGEKEREKDQKPNWQPGETFDATLDDLAFNRVLILKNLPKNPQGNDIGKLFYDTVNKKMKVWLGKTIKWADIQYTTTSTSTTSSSTSTT
jgi:hypothetical protein